jgi:rod shape determining protein RodA
MFTSFRRVIIGSELTPWHAAWLCIIGGLGLSLLGLYAIDLGTNEIAPKAGDLLNMSGLVFRQAVYLAVGLLSAGLIAAPHLRWIRLIAWPLMWILLGLLVLLLVPFVPTWLVHPRNGARAWLELGPIDFQPGELAKVAFVLVMADYLRYRQNHRTVLGLIPPAIIAFVPAVLITLQPDLGMAMLFAPAIFAMLLVAGAKIRHMLAVVSFALCAVVCVVAIALYTPPGSFPLLRPHQQARIVGLFQMIKDPTAGAEGINFQSLRAQMLAGAGGLDGLPDAKVRVLHKYNELPERHNDMILAVVMTRFGLVGGIAMLFLYGVWFAGAFLTAAMCKDPFGQLVVVGLTAILFAQTFINVGMVLGILPIIGLTLPFISYGGTSMVTVWVMTGLIFSVGMRRLGGAYRLSRPTFEFSDTPMYGEARPQPKIAPAASSRHRRSA